jgi:Zn-dependent M16 (insulinase) family peptidase
MRNQNDSRYQIGRIFSTGIIIITKNQSEDLTSKKSKKTKHMDYSKLPSIPDTLSICHIPYHLENHQLADQYRYQVVKTETAFCHYHIFISILNLPNKLLPYLVLFQELLFKTDILFPSETNAIMEYTQVAQYASELLISNSVGVGLGNSTFSCYWLSQFFTIHSTAKQSDFERAIRFMIQVLLFSQFSAERIQVVAQNTLSLLSEVKRDGDYMLLQLGNNFIGHKIDKSINVFEQETFLNQILTQIANNEEQEIIDSLKAIQSFLATEKGIIQISVPRKFSLVADSYPSSGKDIAQAFASVYTEEANKSKKTKKRRKSVIGFPINPPNQDLSQINGQRIQMHIPGIVTSYLAQIVECDPGQDLYALKLLVLMLSSSQGPIFNIIRGKGYAYGASLSLYRWHKQLCFEVYQSTDPLKALAEFHHIIKDMREISTIELETAQSLMIYELAYKVSCPKSVAMNIFSESIYVPPTNKGAKNGD